MVPLMNVIVLVQHVTQWCHDLAFFKIGAVRKYETSKLRK